MNYGIVYKFKQHNKLNGTLFYCFEYFKFLRKFVDAKFYIVDIEPRDLQLVLDIFSHKYNTSIDNIIPIKLLDLYSLKLDKTLVLDVDTFYNVKEFLTNDIHVFSNDTHEMFRYKNDRRVTYYGVYEYQRFDVKCILKLNFEIFKKLSNNSLGVFVSSLNPEYIRDNISRWQKQFAPKPIILKRQHEGFGDLFERIDHVHYVHVVQDTNNRIIPEAFYYGKTVTIEEPLYQGLDSIMLRYNDIQQNGLGNYTITETDAMVQACLE